MRDRITEAIKQSPADYTEIRIEKRQSTNVQYRGKNLESAGANSDAGGIVRCLVKKGGWGTSTFNRIEELENTLERAVILLTGEYISEKELPANIYTAAADDPDPATAARPSWGTRSLEEIEKEAIIATLAACNGNKSEAARRLGITRKTLHNKIKAYHIEPADASR